MIRHLSRIVLAATVAALLGAPSAVFGATTGLTAGSVAPPSGTTATTFTFSVRYDGGGRFEASAVTATVAGSSISLKLSSGTTLLGTWQAASKLPAGSWTVTFVATAARGPQPSPLSGPLIRVTGLVTAPTQTATLKESPATVPTSVVSEAGTPAPTPSAVSMPAPTTAGAAAPSSAAAASPGPTAAPSHAATISGSMQPRTSNPVAPAGAPAATSPGITSAGAPSSTQVVRPRSSPSQSALAGLFGDDPQHPTPSIAFYLLVAMAATTAGGALILLLWRRRDEAPEAAPVPIAPAPSAALPTRSIRGRHLEQADDPILESMGLNRPAERSGRRATMRASASQVHRGPGVREPQPRGRR